MKVTICILFQLEVGSAPVVVTEDTPRLVKSDRETTERLRLSHVTEYCVHPERRENDLFFEQTYSCRRINNIYSYEKLNISYCKVPKVGCTFMVEMFHLLLKGHTNMYSGSRASVHAQNYRYHTSKYTGLPTVTAVRDPYTRLYSAYVDKILIPNMYEISQNIRMFSMGSQTSTNSSKAFTVKCANDVSFQEFLDYAVMTGKTQERVNSHWAPIHSLCKLCDNNNYMILKQESFIEDVTDFLIKLNVSDEEFRGVRDLMTSKRIDATLPGIIKTAFERYEKVTACMSRLQFLGKLWISFQIQGYIAENKTFPENRLREIADEQSVDYFCEFMVNAAKESNLTRVESKQQRLRYLTNAYHNISKKTVREIQQFYKIDFQMFGYSTEPPSFIV